jgi:hypothetical protein
MHAPPVGSNERSEESEQRNLRLLLFSAEQMQNLLAGEADNETQRARRTARGLCAVLAGVAFDGAPFVCRRVRLQQTITKVEFQNPHIYFYIDVKQTDGRVVNYAVEGGTPNQLRRQGWGRDSLKIGETVTVQGFSARKPDVLVVNGRTVILADGRRVFGFSGADEPGVNP